MNFFIIRGSRYFGTKLGRNNKTKNNKKLTIMKKLFFGILAMAAMAACATEDTIVAPQGDEIAFGNPFVDNSVRATTAIDPSYTSSTLEQFNVYGAVNGVNIFDGDVVTGTVGSNAAWTLAEGTPKQYWIAGANYTFDAVVDATRVETDNAGLPVYLAYTADGSTDMLHNRVTTTGKPTTNSGMVAFGFKHLLSKVKFTVENKTAQAASNYQYIVKNIKITNAYASGKYAVVEQKNGETVTDAANTWFDCAVAGADDTVHTVDNLTVASASTQVGANELLLIPGASVGVSFEVEIQMHNGTNWVTIPMDATAYNKNYTAVATLEANKAYNFKVVVGLGDEIKFTATELKTWENGNTADSDGDDVNDIVPVPAN